MEQPTEVNLVFAQTTGVHKLFAEMLHSIGMRLSECAALPIKDVDFQCREITICEGKGGKDRITMLPHVGCTLARTDQPIPIALERG